MPVQAFPADFSVLVIEDSEIDFLITEAQLNKALNSAFRLIWKKNFAEGLACLLHDSPHVALVDYFLHDENGVDLIRRARAEGCRLPLILLTAREDYETDLEAMRAGADEYLVKRQLNPSLLERVLRYVYKVSRQHQQIHELNQELELRVHQRTSELITANFALQESERRMELLKEIASVANASATIDSAFLETLASISHYTGWPLGHVVLARQLESDSPLTLISSDIWYNADPSRYHSLIQRTREIYSFGSETLIGQILEHQRPIWVHLNGAGQANPAYPRFAVALQESLKTMLAFPIRVKGRVTAVIEFFSPEFEESSELMLQLMEEISRQLAYVLERKRAENNLRSTQKSLNLAQHLAKMGSFVGDAATGQLLCSPELQRMLQLPQERISIELLQQRLHPEDRPVVMAAFDAAIHQHQPFSLDHRFLLPDGTEIFAHAQAEIEAEGQHHRAQLVGIVQDISERKRIEEVLVKTREAAETANQAKSAFLASMSHEIRTPMNAILGFAQIMLRDRQCTPAQRQHLTTILRSGEHLLGLINDILEVSKIEAGRVSLHTHPFDLQQLIQDLQSLFAEKITSRGLSLQFEVDTAVPRYLFSDEGKLRQVLINLLSNAVKFTERGGIVVRVKASTTGQSTRLFWEVEDSGCGIAAEELPKVFASFEQTASGIRSQSGTGLGMTISRSYVELLGGELDVSSQLNVGTCFRFDLPVHLTSAAEVAAIERPPRVKRLMPGKAPRVLLVDDRPTNLQLLQEMLSPLGFELAQASNGREGVTTFQAFAPQAILMDSAMPEMNGFEAIQAIRALPEGKEVVIISVSASAFEHDKAAILAAGANDFLAKPVRETDLLEMLKAHLQLEYVYEAPVEEPESEPVSHSLDAVDPELLRQMASALESGDLDSLAELSDRLPQEQAELAAALRAWTDSFAYEQLNTLFDGVSA